MAIVKSKIRLGKLTRDQQMKDLVESTKRRRLMSDDSQDFKGKGKKGKGKGKKGKGNNNGWKTGWKKDDWHQNSWESENWK